MYRLYLNSQGIIESNQLRLGLLTELKTLHDQVNILLHSEKYHEFWRNLHDYIVQFYANEEKESLLAVEAQLLTQDIYIETWIKTAVETPERFEMFIRTKAAEIKSGDKKNDYYWALKIRHDQLVALLTVEQALVGALCTFVQKEVKLVLADSRIQGLKDYPVETQVFLEAEHVQAERVRVEKQSH